MIKFPREFSSIETLFNALPSVCSQEQPPFCHPSVTPVTLLSPLSPSCHPPVTLVTLEKGCKPFVNGRSVTLSPFFNKKPIQVFLFTRDTRYILPIVKHRPKLPVLTLVWFYRRMSRYVVATEKSGCAKNEKESFLNIWLRRT